MIKTAPIFLTLFILAKSTTLQAQTDLGFELTLEEAQATHPNKILVARLLEVSETMIGKPYKYGGRSPAGFDCSGFMNYIFNEIAMELPRTSAMIGNVGSDVSKGKAKIGDIVLFNGSRIQKGTVGHVGIISRIEGEELYFIHASTSSGVREDAVFANPYFAPRFVGIKTWEW